MTAKSKKPPPLLMIGDYECTAEEEALLVRHNVHRDAIRVHNRWLDWTTYGEEMKAAGHEVMVNANAPTFDTQPNGKSFTRGSIQKVFKRWCEEAGIRPELAAHGARKAAASMIYTETGNEAHFCSVFGWAIGSDMARIYARRYDQQRAQQRAMEGLRSAMGGQA